MPLVHLTAITEFSILNSSTIWIRAMSTSPPDHLRPQNRQVKCYSYQHERSQPVPPSSRAY